MTPIQQLELKRFTDPMWVLLRYAGRTPDDAEVYGPLLRAARVLERRGFLKVTAKRNAYSVRLTQAGFDALEQDAQRKK